MFVGAIMSVFSDGELAARGANRPMDFAQAMAFLDCGIPIDKVLRRSSLPDLERCTRQHRDAHESRVKNAACL